MALEDSRAPTTVLKRQWGGISFAENITWTSGALGNLVHHRIKQPLLVYLASPAHTFPGTTRRATAMQSSSYGTTQLPIPFPAWDLTQCITASRLRQVAGEQHKRAASRAAG